MAYIAHGTECFPHWALTLMPVHAVLPSPVCPGEAFDEVTIMPVVYQGMDECMLLSFQLIDGMPRIWPLYSTDLSGLSDSAWTPEYIEGHSPPSL